MLSSEELKTNTKQQPLKEQFEKSEFSTHQNGKSSHSTNGHSSNGSGPVSAMQISHSTHDDMFSSMGQRGTFPHHMAHGRSKLLDATSGRSFHSDQVVRIMIQALSDFGYDNVAEHLQRDSGVSLEYSTVKDFCRCVLNGEWVAAERLIPSLGITSPRNMKKFLILFFRQRYMELLEECKIHDALLVLRERLTPICGSDQADQLLLQKLTMYVMFSTPDKLNELRNQARWGGAKETRPALLNNLKTFFPSDLIVPEKRLLTLLDQAVKNQIHDCMYHNTDASVYSLFENHHCQRRIPKVTHQILREHEEEVWAVQYSHSGKHLASASKGRIIVYNFDGVCAPKERYFSSDMDSVKQSHSSLLPSSNSSMNISSDNVDERSSSSSSGDTYGGGPEMSLPSSSISGTTNKSFYQSSSLGFGQTRPNDGHLGHHSQPPSHSSPTHNNSSLNICQSSSSSSQMDSSSSPSPSYPDYSSSSNNHTPLQQSSSSLSSSHHKMSQPNNTLDPKINPNLMPKQRMHRRKICKPELYFSGLNETDVCELRWSPNDKYLVACASDSVLLYKVERGRFGEKPINVISSLREPSVAWYPNGEQFAVGSLNQPVTVYDLRASQIDLVTNTAEMINQIAISQDASRLVCSTTQQRIMVYNLHTKKCIVEFKEEKTITHFSLSQDQLGKFVLVGVAGTKPNNSANDGQGLEPYADGEVHLWDLDRQRIVRKFVGLKQSRFIVRAAFGGVQATPSAYVISGSEDGQVYIWRRSDGALCEVLSGHSGVVNDVSWNPKNPYVFASASDDHTIRIWGLAEGRTTQNCDGFGPLDHKKMPFNQEALKGVCSDDESSDNELGGEVTEMTVDKFL